MRSAAVNWRAWLRRTIHAFWNAPGAPLNLAIFRVVLFTSFFFSVDLPGAIWYSQIPLGLRIAPFGLRHIIPYVPISPGLARAAAFLLLLFCAMAAAGLFTRAVCWLTVALGLYVLGLPDLFGKVNHLHHHLIWFAALMAVSPCADVLSCDAWRKNSAQREWPADAPKYARPLCFVWLLMGVIYFFPGCWKLWSVGPSWALPGNMRWQMYSKWMEFGYWTPFFRIDHHPVLCALCGIGTILFEVSFIFLVFFQRARAFLFPAGLAFHNMTNMFMRISFWPLQAMYVSFVNWDALFRWLFPKRFGKPERVKAPERGGNTGVNFVGILLLAANIGFGLTRISEAWPFACYPTFAFRAAPQRPVLTLVAESANGPASELPWNALSPHFASDRARGLQEALLRMGDSPLRHQRFKALWKLWRQNHPELNEVRAVSFYKDTLSTLPDQALRQLIRREFLGTLSASDQWH